MSSTHYLTYPTDEGDSFCFLHPHSTLWADKLSTFEVLHDLDLFPVLPELHEVYGVVFYPDFGSLRAWKSTDPGRRVYMLLSNAWTGQIARLFYHAFVPKSLDIEVTCVKTLNMIVPLLAQSTDVEELFFRMEPSVPASVWTDGLVHILTHNSHIASAWIKSDDNSVIVFMPLIIHAFQRNLALTGWKYTSHGGIDTWAGTAFQEDVIEVLKRNRGVRRWWQQSYGELTMENVAPHLAIAIVEGLKCISLVLQEDLMGLLLTFIGFSYRKSDGRKRKLVEDVMRGDGKSAKRVKRNSS